MLKKTSTIASFQILYFALQQSLYHNEFYTFFSLLEINESFRLISYLLITGAQYHCTSIIVTFQSQTGLSHI